MDKNQRKEVKNPRENASTLSIITFWWILKLFVIGYKKELEETDLYSPLREDKSNALGEVFVEAWAQEVERCNKKKDGSKPRLIRVIYNCFGRSILLVGFPLFVLEFVVRLAIPFFLARLLRYFSGNPEQWEYEVYYFAGAFCILQFVDSFLAVSCFQFSMHIGMKMRIACSTLIYRKILTLSNTVLENETSTGQIINFLSKDMTVHDYLIPPLHYLWIGPLQTLAVACIIFNEIGWPALTGMITFFLFIPVQFLLGRKVSQLRFILAEKTDTRLRLMNQVIAGIEIIKMYVWELPYSLLVEKARRKEVNVIKKYSIVEQFSFTFDIYVPRLCLFVTILSYVLAGNNINAEKVFMIAAYYEIIRASMTICFPLSVHEIAKATVTLKRFEKLMRQPEMSKPEMIVNRVATPSIPIYLEDATARWDEDRDHTLMNINLTIAKGSLVAVIGQIGTGKSSLLQAILRELPLESGVLEVNGRISYVNQQAWIFASSIRQNILFGQPMDKARYDEVIRVCQLRQDIDYLPHGDSTIVGERGINLSGGQRARISLARALYAEADIYLLDDPLSAVDAHVGNSIVEECICGYLKGKTRILVTHQLQYLKSTDLIVVMNNGRVEAKGSFEELRESRPDFMDIFKADENEKKEESRLEKDRRYSVGEEKMEEKNLKSDPVEVTETRAVGRVSPKLFLSYWKASGSLVIVFFLLCFFVVSEFTAKSNDYWVAFWVDVETSSWKNETEFQWQGPVSRDGIIYIYSTFTVAMICLNILLTFFYFGICMKASRNLHANMFRSVIRSRMYFYNTNPAGRILNRFSEDIGVIDDKLTLTMYDVVMMFLTFFGTVTIIGVVNPWLLIPTCVVIVIFYCLRVIYISTSRAVKRIEGTARSPVFDHVGATLQGVTTIRAFKAQKILTKEFDNHQDLHTSAWYIFFSTSRAFALYIELFCVAFISLITIAFLVFHDLASAGDIGLVITQLMSIIGALQWGIRQTAELENQMTSVERVLEYSSLEEEPFLDGKSEVKPPKDWPNEGLVEFKDVKLKYGPNGAYVLKGITLTVMPKEKVGIVGRTGAGKTSLISALFRLAYVEGDIFIDRISTSSIALQDFRSKISIIPQEPILFAGSLRKNLDPFEEYPDDVLWDVLQQVELKETISDMVAGLNSKVTEDGSNFSVGQRQLLCLARALIRNNKIMILDEATANVDPQTDSLIQETVRKKFTECTVFTIAHRLNTVMDSDKIVVMDSGQLVEYDHPYVLLQKKGYFYEMVEKTGPSMAANLLDIAKNNFYRKNESSS